MKDEPVAYQSANLFRLIAKIVIKTSIATVLAFAFLIAEEDLPPCLSYALPSFMSCARPVLMTGTDGTHLTITPKTD